MILLMGGTQDARSLLTLINRALPDSEIIVTVVTDYGAELLRQQGGCEVWPEALDAAGLQQLIAARQVKVLVDATHPFAATASVQGREAARRAGINYLRYERPASGLEAADGVYFAPDFTAAAQLAARLGQQVFLTIGSRHLAECLAVLGAKTGVVARILPDEKSLDCCLQLGLLPKQIVAMQGPVSTALNVALFREYGADVVISKESGVTGGTPEKVAAARECGIPIIIVERPAAAKEALSAAEIITALTGIYQD